MSNKEFEKAELEQRQIYEGLVKQYYEGNEEPLINWMKNIPPLPKPMPIYFLLADDDEVILHIGDDLDDRTGKKSINLHTSMTYDPRRPSAGFHINTIIQGMYGLALVLFCDHEPHWIREVGNSWPNLIKDENNFFNSYPLFVADCSFGCCGGADLGIYLEGDMVKIIRERRPGPEESDKEYIVNLDEYLEVVIRCLEELYKMGSENGRPDAFWFMIFLLKKASLEGRKEIRKPLIKKFMKFVNDNNVYLDGW